MKLLTADREQIAIKLNNIILRGEDTTNYLANNKEKEDNVGKDNIIKEFYDYVSKKYGAKGRRAIRFSSRYDEFDILLGLKNASKFDEEDRSYLSEKQLEELEKFIKKEDDSKMFALREQKFRYIKSGDEIIWQ